MLRVALLLAVALVPAARAEGLDGCSGRPPQLPRGSAAGCPEPARAFRVRNDRRSAGALLYFLRAERCAKCIQVYRQPPSTSSYEVRIPEAFCAAPSPAKPNIVLMMADDISARDFGFNGASYVRTPNLDRLARRSLHFVNAWATPLCLTTRAMLLTGKLPYETKWFSHKERPPAPFWEFGPGLGNLAKRAGYNTLIAGKWSMFGKARGRGGYGFDQYSLIKHSDVDNLTSLYKRFDGRVFRDNDGTVAVDQNKYAHPIFVKNDQLLDTNPNDFSSNLVLDHIQSFMRENKREGRQSFVYWPSPLAHKEFNASLGYTDWAAMPILNGSGKIIGFDSSKPSFPKMIGYMDRMIGLLIKGLKRDGLYQNTLFIFCSDNGSPPFTPSLDRHKGATFREGSVRVPVIFHHGGGLVPAGKSPALFSLIDIYSTLAGFMGVPSQARPNSVNFRQFVTGSQEKEPRKWLFAFQKNDRMVRVKDWFMNRSGNIFRCTQGGTTCEEKVDPATVPAARRAKEVMLKILRALERSGSYDPGSL